MKTEVIDKKVEKVLELLSNTLDMHTRNHTSISYEETKNNLETAIKLVMEARDENNHIKEKIIISLIKLN